MSNPEPSDVNNQSLTQKGYGELIVYALLFILFITSIFVFNINLSDKSREHTVRILCAQHQQRAWQKALKSLEQARIGLYTGQPTDSAFIAFSMSMKKFGECTIALHKGKPLIIEQQELNVLPPDDEVTQQIIASIYNIWLSGKDDMNRLIDNIGKGTINPQLVEQMLEFAVRNDDQILDYCQEFMVKLSQLSDERVGQLQTSQISALVLSFLVFIAMGVRSTISLRARDKVIDERNQELKKQHDTIAKEKETIEDLLEDLQNTQTQLIQSEKMATLGQMVAGLVHEVNTPLGFIKSNVDILKRNVGLFEQTLQENRLLVEKLADGDLDDLEAQLHKVQELYDQLNSYNLIDKTNQRLNDSIMGLDRLSDLVLNLKNFSRLDEASAQNVNINECIDTSLLIANHLVKNRANIIKDYGQSIDAECFPAQLNQVFLNLITNAAQAMPVNQTTDGKPELGTIAIKTRQKDGLIHISIEDNGTGIDPQKMKKIFEPFFTTKPVGEGTGLGLAIVCKIIEKHAGKIKVKSTVGKGTRFEISLPMKLAGKEKFDIEYSDLVN